MKVVRRLFIFIRIPNAATAVENSNGEQGTWEESRIKRGSKLYSEAWKQLKFISFLCLSWLRFSLLNLKTR